MPILEDKVSECANTPASHRVYTEDYHGTEALLYNKDGWNHSLDFDTILERLL